jgi:branched-chain amino acid transport system substrate-binding protein
LSCLGASEEPTVLAAPANQEIGALSNGSVITIGTASELTGPLHDCGWQQVNAVQLAISQTNAAGGINIGGASYTVTLAIADDAGDATQAITAANELLAAGSVAVVGHTGSPASMVAASIYYTAGVAMVSPSSTNPQLTQQGYTTTFRTTPHDGSAAIRLAEYFISLDLKRTAILLRHDNLEWMIWSDAVGNMYQSAYTGLGGTVVSSRTITATTDITPALTAIQTENVDVILVTDGGDVAGNVSRVAYSMGMTPTISCLGIYDDYISTYAGVQAAEGDYGAMGGRRTSNMPGYAAFESAYLAANFPNEPNPGYFSPASYDAANIIMDAIRRANTTDTLAIRDEIAATTNYAGVVGTYQGFDANGDVVPQWARIEVVENSEWVPAWLVGEIYPDQGGTFDLDNTLGQTTTIEIPAGTTTETLVITYTLVATTTNAGVPTMAMMGEHAIRLEPNVSVSNPMTITIEYEDEDVVGVDESTLTLYTWNGSQWVDAEPCGGYIRDLYNNILKIIICHFSDYVLLGERQYTIYLPIILKASP